MSRPRDALAVMLLLALGSGAAVSQPPPAAPVGPLKVTTDTAEYCDNLADRVAAARRAHPTVQPEVEKLAQEGQRMCDTGLVRGGLLRLRRALLMLRTDQ